jgi:hypothetical protein
MARTPQADKHRQVGTSNVQRDTAASLRDRVDAKLDEALKATFPASDPFALTVDEDPNSRAIDAFATVDEDPNSRATYASPPCFMHELDPSYLGLAPDRDVSSADHDEPEATTEKASDAK